MAPIATASCCTRKVIQNSLCIFNCSAVWRVPNKLNIRYAVRQKPDDPRTALQPAVWSYQQNGQNANKCTNGEVTCDMFTRSSHEDDWSRILPTFTNPLSFFYLWHVYRCTLCLQHHPLGSSQNHWWDMCRRVADVDVMVQIAVLYSSHSDLAVIILPQKKAYCLNESKCRWELLMEEFYSGGNFSTPAPFHNCCDVCSLTCKCEDCLEAQALTWAELELAASPVPPPTHHQLSSSMQQTLQASLEAYHMSLFTDTSCPPLFGIEVISGISDTYWRCTEYMEVHTSVNVFGAPKAPKALAACML